MKQKMKINKHAIFKDAERRLSKRTIPFKNWLLLTSEAKKVLRDVFLDCAIPNRKDAQHNFEVLLANLFYIPKKRSIEISMDSNAYKKNRYNTVGDSIRKYVHALEEKGYIVIKNGYHNKQNPAQSLTTKIIATQKLLDYLPELNNGIIGKPTELVELRDDEGKLIDYTDNETTNTVRKVLEEANQVNMSAEIKYFGNRLTVFLVAVYKNDFESYGRLHTRGYQHYQGLDGNERAEITINGESVGELDYCALHPTLLYALEGRQYLGDPYSVVDKRPEVRPFLKRVLLALLNSKDFTQAEKASNYWLFNNHTDRKQLKKLGITRARPLMKKMMEVHKPIAHHFCSGKKNGLKVMNKDAQIALSVIEHFTKQGFPILAVHDSFLVQRKYLKELKQVMKRTYYQHTNGFRIQIK